MEDTTISIIGIIVAAILMFIVPLVLIADRADDLYQLTAQTATVDFVDDVIKSGKITSESYQKYILALETTGNTFDIDIELKILDDNSAKHTTDTTGQIGINTYYSLYTSQIEDKLSESDKRDDGELNDTGKIVLKEGDEIYVTASNSSKTLSQTLKDVYYKIKGENLHIIVATASGTIAINGST